MPKTVSASEAKTRFGAIMDWAVEHKDEVIVETHGEPKAVIMPFEEYKYIVQLRDMARRREALARLENLRERVQARNQDLTENDANRIASRFTREVVAEMVKEGKIKYQGR